MKRSIRATRLLAATGIVAAGLLAAACGEGVTADAATHRPDYRQLVEAERFERIAKLEGLAWTYGNKADPPDNQPCDFLPNSRHVPC
jgi:hypothetical protein